LGDNTGAQQDSLKAQEIGLDNFSQLL
jgi:hypothetical protein